jgi:hypothetical protein
MLTNAMCKFFKLFIFKGGFHEISADFGKPNVKSTTCKKNLHMGLLGRHIVCTFLKSRYRAQEPQ